MREEVASTLSGAVFVPEGDQELLEGSVPLLPLPRPATHQQRPVASLQLRALRRAARQWQEGSLPGDGGACLDAGSRRSDASGRVRAHDIRPADLEGWRSLRASLVKGESRRAQLRFRGPGSLSPEARRAATQVGFAVLEKKAARPADGGGRRESRVGHRLFGLMLVEQGGFAHFERFLRGGGAPPHDPAVGREGRPRAEGHILLRLYLPRLDGMWIRFVDGRPVSSVTTQFLSWCCEELEKLGKKVLLLIWDNASWHVSKEVRRWLGKHNRKVKNSGGEAGVRILSCLLPKQSPWLNAIEPKWVHGKRRVVEFDGLLGAYELADRVCGLLVVRITGTSPLHRRSLDRALMLRSSYTVHKSVPSLPWWFRSSSPYSRFRSVVLLLGVFSRS